MESPSTFRTDCCQLLWNACADEARGTLTISVSSFRSRHRAGRVITIVLHDDGRLLGTCRHEVLPERAIHWSEWCAHLMAVRLEH